MITLKTKKVVCDCGGKLTPKKMNGDIKFTAIIVYSTEGSEEGRHCEYRQGYYCKLL